MTGSRLGRFGLMAAAVVVAGAWAGSIDRATVSAQATAAVQATPGAPHNRAVAMPHILTLREQAAVYNAWLRSRLETIVPELMREEGFDMWLVICRENVEDPVYFPLVPFTTLYASRTQILVFFDRGAPGVERFSVNFRQMGEWYKSVWEPARMDQWAKLAEVIRERNPKVIGINESDVDHYGDGLTASLKARLVSSIGPEYARRLKSAERLAVRLLERRTAGEIEVYPQIVAIAHAIIAEAFSNQVITPGVTTTEDVVWWMRERSRQLGFTNWFQPSVSIQRPDTSPHKNSPVIHRGDLLHCDFGIVYLNLCTDTQQQAYVLAGRRDRRAQGPRWTPSRRATACRTSTWRSCGSGAPATRCSPSALKRAKAEGLEPSIYSHPLGVHGHAAGAPVGLTDKQDGVPGDGDYPFFADTVHSIELNVRATVPEWGSQKVRIALEQDAVLNKDGPRFLDRRQTALHLIR